MQELQSERLNLHPLDNAHRDLLTELETRPEVRDFIGALAIRTGPGTDHLFAITHADQQIGIVGIVPSQLFDGHDVELICALVQTAEGQGYAFEACRLVVDWAGRAHRWTRLLARVHDRNKRSRTLVERLGFAFVNRRPLGDEDVYALSILRAA